MSIVVIFSGHPLPEKYASGQKMIMDSSFWTEIFAQKWLADVKMAFKTIHKLFLNKNLRLVINSEQSFCAETIDGSFFLSCNLFSESG